MKRAFDPSPYIPLTPAMFQVLVSLADGEKHGYAIIKEVARRTGGKVKLRPATLYTVIKRFVDAGLIEETSVRPGVAVAAASVGALCSLLFDVEPLDPGVFGSAVAVLLLTAAAACWLPAWRASRIDPSRTLRAD